MRRVWAAMYEEAEVTCDQCGEWFSIQIDLLEGESQQFVIDCPVCCRPNEIHVEISQGGAIDVRNRLE